MSRYMARKYVAKHRQRKREEREREKRMETLLRQAEETIADRDEAKELKIEMEEEKEQKKEMEEETKAQKPKKKSTERVREFRKRKKLKEAECMGREVVCKPKATVKKKSTDRVREFRKRKKLLKAQEEAERMNTVAGSNPGTTVKLEPMPGSSTGPVMFYARPDPVQDPSGSGWDSSSADSDTFLAMSSLTLNPILDRTAFTPSWGKKGPSVKKSAGRYGKQCSRTGLASGLKTTPRDRLLEQLEVCCEELNVAIMAELDERERINQELREQVHQELDIARGLIYYNPSLEGLMKVHAKLESIVIDRSKRVKSDNLRKLLESIKILQTKAGINEEKPTKASAVVELVTSTTSTPVSEAVRPSAFPVKVTSPVQSPSIVSPTKPATPTPESAPFECTKLVPADSTPEVSSGSPLIVPETHEDIPAEEEIRPPREIISEAAKLRQRPQIPWRTPTRLEPLRDPRYKSEKSIKDDVQKKVPAMPEPLPLKEPERLALRYKTKVRKRSADEPLPPPTESQFKKPFAIPEVEPQKPLFQRRHQLAPPTGGPRAGNFPVPSRDPRNYGDYCNRRMTLTQNKARFERQNQQYRPPQRQQQQHGQPARPVAAAHPFAVPAPVPPTPPVHRPPAPKASVAPNSSRPFVEPVAPPAAPVPPAAVVRNDTRKTNPVYNNDEPIRLGKKDDPKKQVSPLKPAEEPEAKTVEKETEKVTVQEPEKATEESKKIPTQKEKDNALKTNLYDLLKELGDEKAQKILDVMGKKSDDESEEQSKKQEQQEEAQQAKRGKTPAEKKAAGKKFKRIRAAKLDDSSSEDEAAQQQRPSTEQAAKKEKSAKPTAKRASGGSREVSALIENSSDWMAKGTGESHYTRRRGTAVQQLISPRKKNEDKNSTQVISDEEGGSSKQQVEDPLLTVAKVVPAAPTTKGKQKNKESTIVYNDKKTIHCNSNFSSNCALCSFNGSAIVDHYVYDHKTYEVFVSRVSPKMADIIRSDLFVTNGTLVTVGDNNEEKIRFKCFFCLAPKELGRAEWTDHLSSHTGEYRYRCTSCPVMSRTEELDSKFFHEKSCLKPTLALYNNIEFEDNHVFGFICDACNYIQIRRVNMERHLKREHPSSDVTCSRFSILNYKVETKPIVDEELLMMADMSPSPSQPTVMIPFTAKSEPMDTYEIVNQPFTEDEDMPELPQLPRRTEIRLESVHIGQVGGSLPNQLAQLPFTIKMEPGLQQEAITSSTSYESPMSPEPTDSSEAQPSIPILQIQYVSGGVDLSAYSTVKQEKPDDDGCESDASDATVDLNLSGEQGRQCATDANQQSSNGTTTPTGSESSGSGGAANAGTSSSGGGQAAAGGAAGAGAGGNGGDDRKKEEFPVPLQIKVEKDDEAAEEEEEEKKKKQELEGVTTAMENVKVKTEKPDRDSPQFDASKYDFVELVLDSKRMQYVAYVERNSEALFLCILPGCNFITKVADNLKNHIAKKHARVLWDGYCQICRSQITPADCPITEEFQHLLTIHARKKTPPLETVTAGPSPAPVVTAPNVIRIRKMPGDMLSLGDVTNPPPLMPIVQPPVLGQPLTSPMILQSGATISPASIGAGPVPVALNQLFTPTHTIPAQIRPITATVGPNITVTPVIRAPTTIQSGPMRTVRLKPWTNMVTTKSQEHCRDMLEEISLLCLFKCMSRACAFTSNNRMMMAQHLANHDQVHRAGPTSMRKCWLECAYCDLIAPNSGDLLVHIDTEHANCGFQCNLCFYRSRDPTNVVVHQKDHHPASDIPKKILIMPDNLKSFGNEEWLSMQESLRQHVLPLHCTICKESFYILSAYMTHLTSHSQCMINCQVCHATIDKKVMARHLLQHSIGLYECVYCLFGANTKSTMALHVSNAHSSKPLYCCVRYNKQRLDGVEYPPNKIESMELKTMSCTVSPDLFKRCNYTQAELNFKTTDLESNRTMSYRRITAAGSSMETVNTSTASNIQIQITDEAGRPLIISIPVKNPSQPVAPVPVPGPSTAPVPGVVPSLVGQTPVPVAIHSVQMPTISTVQGGVTINQSIRPNPPNQAPLPVIASVQGSLPPLTAISQLKQPGLPVISSVQSIAPPPPLTINPAAVPRSSSPAVVSTSGVGTSYSIPATISAVSSSSTSTSDIYTKTVAEADTQSHSAADLVSGGGVAVESDGSGSKCSTPVQSQSPAPSSSSVTTTTSTTSTTVGGLKTAPAKKLASTTQIRIDFLFNGSIDKFDRLERKVSEMIKHTGFCGQELNACGVEKCNSRYSDPVKLNLHLLKHHSVSSYKCYHCIERFKTAHELITHIKTHGRHRYLCFLCDAKSHFLKMMIVHVQHDHKSSDVILTYLHPKKRDIHNDLVVICPQDVTQIQLQDYINKILEEDDVNVVQKPVQPAKKKKFAPSEIDQLPIEEIFSEDFLCANCDYATKIRKNLKRHLEKHLDPPVEGVPVVVSPALVAETSSTPTPPTVGEQEKPIEPQLIEPSKLYQCGICKFECDPLISEFRTHLYRIHRHEKVYKCPHCGMVVNNGFLCIDKIVNHLKLHREKLYKCSECEYYRDEKYLIPQHLKKSHAGVAGACVVTIRENGVQQQQLDHEWQCDLCETIRRTREEMVEHMTGDHKLSNKQYKCSYCSYKSSEHDSFKVHFAESHPKCEILIISLFHALPSAATGQKKVVAAPVVGTSATTVASLELEEPGAESTTTTTPRKKFSCGSESCSFASFNLKMVKKHFQDHHPEESLVVFDDTGIEREKRKRFDYFVKYGCGYCADKFPLMDDVIEHWYNTHKGTGEQEKPLMFKLFKLVRCMYCDMLSTYDEIKEHCTAEHPGQLFACIDHQNVFKCGECPHVLENHDSADLLKHFKIYHSFSKVEDPCDYIDDEFLHRMLEQNNSRYTCNHCLLEYNSRFEYECHIADCEYAGLPSSFKTTPKSVAIQFNCSGCDASFSSEFAIADHIRTHLNQYSCNFCKREFKELHRLDQHQVEFHNVSHDATIILKDLNQHRMFFTKIRMLFPNGLLLSKMDAHRTVCGSVEDIMNHVRAINAKEVYILKLQKSLQMPLFYENDAYETVETTCAEFLDSQPTQFTLPLENLTPENIAEIQEQVYALHKVTHHKNQQRKRGRPRKTNRVIYSESAEEEDDDDEWTPAHKRIGWSRPTPSRPSAATSVTVKKEYEESTTTTSTPTMTSGRVSSRVSSSSSDDELLINFKKEKLDEQKQEVAVSVKEEKMEEDGGVVQGAVSEGAVGEGAVGEDAVGEGAVDKSSVGEGGATTEMVIEMPLAKQDDNDCEEEGGFEGF